MRVWVGFLSFVLVLVWMSELCARDHDPATIHLPSVQVRHKRPPLMASESPVTVIEIPEGVQASENLADYLEEVPGVEIRRDGGPGSRSTVSIRGADGKQVAVLIEGFSSADPKGDSVDLSTIPLEAVERIEVYKGARGALAGNGALGGVVVVRLRRNSGSTSSARAQAGAFGTWGLAARMKGKRWMLLYDHQHTKGDFPFVDTNGVSRIRRNNDSTQDRLLLTHRWPVSSRLMVDSMAKLSLASRGVPGLEQFPTPEADSGQHSLLLGTRLSVRRFPWKRAHTSIAASFGGWRWTFRNPTPYLPPAVDTLSLSHRTQVQTETTHRITSWMTMSHVLSGVWESMRQERASASAMEVDRPLGDLTLASTLGPFPTQIKTTARVRITGNPDHGFQAVPALEASWEPLSGLSILLSGSRAYRIPGFEELYFESSGIRGNPDLDPEDAWGIDATVRWDWRWLSLEASVFRQWVLDSILFMTVTPYLIEAQNTGRVDITGVETAAMLRWDWLVLKLGGRWLDTQLPDGNRRLPLRPTWQGFSTLQARWWRLKTTVQLHVQDRFYLDRFNSRYEEKRLGLGASLGIRLPADFRLNGQVRNILNKRDSLDAFQQPLPGISWFVAIEKRWGNSTTTEATKTP